jgi:tyrosine-protein kinase Etk/Wzc
MENNDNLLGLVSNILRNRKFIFRVTIIAAIISAVFSFIFMKDYYKSTTVFYAASSDLFKPELIFGNGSGQKAMEYYGDESDIDRILTIANSNEVSDYLIKKYNLFKHYDIDSTKRKSRVLAKKAFYDLFEVTKTKYDALELSIEDVDPEIAAEMTNDAREKINSIACNLVKSSQAFLIKSFEDQIVLKEARLVHLSDTLRLLRGSYGVYDFETQIEAMSKTAVEAEANMVRTKAKLGAMQSLPDIPKDSINFTKANLKGYESEVAAMSGNGSSDFNLKRYNKGVNSVSIAYQEYVREKNQLVEDRMKYNQIKATYTSINSALHLIEKGEVPVDKSRPHRSLIILGSIIIAFLFSIIGLILFETFKNVTWKEAIK